MTSQTMAGKHWLVLLLTAAMFGSSFLFIKIAVADVPPLSIAAARVGIAAPLVWIFLRLTGGSLPRLGAGWAPFVLVGCLAGVIPFTAIAWGQLHIDSGLAGILFGTIPVFSVLFAPLIAKDETVTSARLIGAFVGVGGVAVVVGPQAFAGLDGQLLGAGVTLLAPLSYALGATYTRRRQDIPPVTMATGQLIVAAAILVPLSALVDAPWTLAPSTPAMAALTAAAVFSTAAPMVLLFWLIRAVGASNGSLAAFFMPVVAVVLGAAVLGEALAWQAFAGLALILVGAAFVNGRLSLSALRGARATATAND